MDLARQLQQYRAEHHLTVRELAACLGLPEQNVWRLIENGSRQPALDTSDVESALRMLNEHRLSSSPA